MLGQQVGDGDDPGRPWVELAESGLLWVINASAFHPRGLALVVHVDGKGVASGWHLTAAGPGEAYRYAVPCELDDPSKAVDVDEAFRLADATITAARAAAAPPDG